MSNSKNKIFDKKTVITSIGAAVMVIIEKTIKVCAGK